MAIVLLAIIAWEAAVVWAVLRIIAEADVAFFGWGDAR